jgi:hypothetical protein
MISFPKTKTIDVTLHIDGFFVRRPISKYLINYLPI